MYGFDGIKGLLVKEYFFKKGSCYSAMSFSDGDPDPHKRQIFLVPGFYMDESGAVFFWKTLLVHPELAVSFLPPKTGVETQLNLCVEDSKIKPEEVGNYMVILCANEETKEIGMVVVPKKKWVPVFSTIKAIEG